jgi:hypothetical protein
MQDSWIKPSYWDTPTHDESEYVQECIGKKVRGDFRIACRNEHGQPSVIENAPFFYDGTPMPTHYWLIDPALSHDVALIESSGGVDEVEDEYGLDRIAEIHHRYEQERDSFIAQNFDGPRPSGGVGGTRRGVKCLHAHVAHFLATGDDFIGQWTMEKIKTMKENENV